MLIITRSYGGSYNHRAFASFSLVTSTGMPECNCRLNIVLVCLFPGSGYQDGRQLCQLGFGQPPDEQDWCVMERCVSGIAQEGGESMHCVAVR